MSARAGVALVGVLWIVGCGAQADPAPTSPPDTDAPATMAPGPTTPPSTLSPAEPIDWSDSTVVVDLGNGWSARKCEGDAPLVCVARHGEHLGLIEANRYPRASYDVGGDDPQEVLIGIAADFLEDMAADRGAGCGPEYRIDPHPVDRAVVAGLPGISFGYEGYSADGSTSERIAQFATMVGDDILFLTAAAYDEGGCPGRDELGNFISTDLSEFEPHLARLVAATPVPEG